MNAYRYRAARIDGAIVSGVVDAATVAQASARVTDLGLFPVALLPVDADEPMHGAASRQDLAIVFRSIAALVSAGVPLERAVAASASLARGALQETLGAACTGLREGQSLAQALARERGVVPGVVLGMIRAGERGSDLSAALEQVASHLEQEAELVARVRQALAYPLLLAVVGSMSVLVIGMVIVPRFAELLGDLGEDLPVATRVLIASSSGLVRFWFLVLPIVATAVWMVGAALQRPMTQRRVADTLLGLPGIGAVRLALATARFAGALGGMLRAGMPLLAALDAAREAAGDVAVAERLARSRERVTQGTALTVALEHEGALLASALQLLAVGESSGRLGEMALRASQVAAQEGERGLRTLVTFVEPALIIGFGAMVAFVAAALLQAVYAIRPGGF
jgi:type II secretory pathway component PulF